MVQNREVYLQNNLFFSEIKQLLDKHKSVHIRVKGNSMLPFIRHNDTVVLVSPTSEKIRKGSVVVAFTDEMGYVMHRIYTIKNENITLLGDGNTGQFEHSDLSRVIAVVVCYTRGKRVFSINSSVMRVIGLLWMSMHPWRKHLVSFWWKLKTKLVK